MISLIIFKFLSKYFFKKIKITLLFSLLFSCSIFAQVNDTIDYFPLRIGNRYIYYGTNTCPPYLIENRYGPKGSSRIIDTIILNKKKYYTTLITRLDVGIDTVRVDSIGNMIIFKKGKERIFYKFNANVGESWDYIDTISGREYNYKVTLKSRTDTVKIHAGSFTNCLRFYFNAGGFDQWFIDWLAPNFGFVFRCIQESYEVYEAEIDGRHYPFTSVPEEKSQICFFKLYQNYPNPFNPETIIRYELNTTGRVKLTIYDVLGRIIRNLVDEFQLPGIYEIKWDGKDFSSINVPSGVYIYRLIANKYQVSKLLFKIK